MSRQKSLGLGSGHKGFRFRHLPLPLLVLGILFAALQDNIALFQHTTGDNGISQRDEAEHDDSLRNNNNFPPILEKDGKRENKGTLLILEKVSKTGTTSLRNHLFEVMNFDDGYEKKYRKENAAKEVCFRSSNGYSNKTHPEIIKPKFRNVNQSFPPCSCEMDVFLSHMSRIPEKMDTYFGMCNLTNVDVLSVIPLRLGTRIDSEIQYGHKILCLDPTKSIFDNCMDYKFNPYVEYSHNPLATRTCIFDFMDGTFQIPHSNPTKNNRFDCTTKVCEDSIKFAKREEAKHIQQLQEKFPLCDVEELRSLLLLPLEEGGQENNRTLNSQ